MSSHKEIFEDVVNKSNAYYNDYVYDGDMEPIKEVMIEVARQAFEQSRLTHPMAGFKYDTFEDYLKAITSDEGATSATR